MSESRKTVLLAKPAADDILGDNDSLELWDILERDHPEYIKALHDDEWALAELGPSFLGFVGTYKRLATLIPRRRIVYDFGCCYAAQAWYFRDHTRYVGINPHLGAKLNLANALYYSESAQAHIERFGPFGKDTFAIVNYVPDDGAGEAVRGAFRDMYSFYPERSDRD